MAEVIAVIHNSIAYASVLSVFLLVEFLVFKFARLHDSFLYLLFSAFAWLSVCLSDESVNDEAIQIICNNRRCKTSRKLS